MELLGHVVLSGDVECLTGLHIGDEGALEIGGVNGPVVKTPTKGHPYIPGSSIKGKMRSLLEWDEGLVESDGKPHTCEGDAAVECPVCRVFGTPAEADAETGPTRLSVRDAFPRDETIEQWNDQNTSLPYTEVKTENTINRITAQANLRDNERVPKGSRFGYELIYGVYDLDDGGRPDLDHLATVERALFLLEDSSLGGNGSRGYGKVEFHEDEYKVRTSADYRSGDKDGRSAETLEEVGEILGVE
ncbi:type III-A CRISPR-associated RAMP protein Csm3 [Halocatena marina]|uniref:CRISPR system Cms endoribonuclease Csm3 n=2 Tax=Halocatena marina TaxID=2934937 RepID=A0ABD5YW84_9EURY|nr:type III-A CRISPR-associated RAMP protein Csm3 [Halocatena marina]